MLALELGTADSSSHFPLAVAILGELVTSMILSLLVVPVVFSLLVLMISHGG